jgi:predicted GTPase
VKRPEERDEQTPHIDEQLIHSSLIPGRHLDHAVVLILGVSGHGKSKTINTLVGRDILSVAKSSDGSITEVCVATSLSLMIFS